MRLSATLKDIQELSLRRGFVFPSSEEYGGFSGFFDWGPLGSQLKKNLKDLWWRFFVEDKDFVIGLDGSIITHPRVWKASGHVDKFSDPIVRCTICGKVYRADHLVEEILNINTEELSIEQLQRYVDEIPCPSCGGKLGKVETFNLMFRTYVGPYDGVLAYLRPETAQLIFVNFPRLYHFNRKKLPFGVAQIGKAFRNEISPRNFLFRLREFEQMEIEFFFDPENDNCPYFDKARDLEVLTVTIGDQKRHSEGEYRLLDNVIGDYPGREWMIYWIAESLRFMEFVGIDMERIRIRQQLPDERAHYSMDTWDVEFHFDDLGWKEIEGIAHRSDYDLSRHAEYSGSNKYRVKREDGTEFTPWVIEPSFGVERILLAVLYSSYQKDNQRTWLSLRPWIVPVQVAVFPLVSKGPLSERAREIYRTLKRYFRTSYDEGGSIGKRYRRYDEIGTPYVVTVDSETLKDETVTVRDRDTMEQERIPIDQLVEHLRAKLVPVI